METISSLFDQGPKLKKVGLNLLTANSMDNMFIPLSALKTGTLYTLEKKRLLLYTVSMGTDRYSLVPYNAIRGRNSANAFFLSLNAMYFLSQVTTEPLGMRYFANNHLIYSYNGADVKVLMALTIEKDFLFGVKDYRTMATNKNIVLMYDNDIDSEQHKWLKNKLTKLYLPKLKELNISIFKTPDIHHWCFNNIMPNIPVFSTISERIQYLSSNTKRIFDGQPAT